MGCRFFPYFGWGLGSNPENLNVTSHLLGTLQRRKLYYAPIRFTFVLRQVHQSHVRINDYYVQHSFFALPVGSIWNQARGIKIKGGN